MCWNKDSVFVQNADRKMSFFFKAGTAKYFHTILKNAVTVFFTKKPDKPWIAHRAFRFLHESAQKNFGFDIISTAKYPHPILRNSYIAFLIKKSAKTWNPHLVFILYAKYIKTTSAFWRNKQMLQNNFH